MRKLLIVNADDFGASHGTNRGIFEAHMHGIVTSASLLVNASASEAAARLAGLAPQLSVGLHADLDGTTTDRIALALEQQLERFRSLMRSAPTHVDTHHDTHRRPEVLPAILEFARRHGLPLRGYSPVRVCTKFYGQWSGETHLEQISVSGLDRVLAAVEDAPVTELTCHPGYPDPEFRSSYVAEREAELDTLCNPAARLVLAARGFQLTRFGDLPAALAGAPA